MSGGAEIEFKYAEPFAEALYDNSDFRKWVLGQTVFARFGNVRLLRDEIAKKRSSGTRYWWRHHYTHKCTCSGCDGRETDIFAIGYRISVRLTRRGKTSGGQIQVWRGPGVCLPHKSPVLGKEAT